MVLGVLLYEGMDIMVHLGKITYNTARGIYYWYYGCEYPEVEREKRTLKDVDILIKRLAELEDYVHIKREISLEDK
jgi:hypothetical protein